jgi:hypothetical protein
MRYVLAPTGTSAGIAISVRPLIVLTGFIINCPIVERLN